MTELWLLVNVLLAALVVYVAGALASWWTFFGYPTSLR